MIRTPQYKLGFNQSGEPYSASNDLDRMVVVDNQLIDLSQISGDGVLTGWNISTDGTTVTVSPGSGFIDGILNRTYASKAKPIVDMATTKVYMQTNMNNTQDNPAIGQTQGLDLEMESPRSPIASATFLDAIPPAAPSDFVATLSDTVFNEIDLGWSKNTELDFDHYELQRGSSALG